MFHLRGVIVDVGGVGPRSSLSFDRLHRRVSNNSMTSSTFSHVTRLNFHIKSRNLGLPSERVASINMHSIAYLSPQLFHIVQRFPRTARGCVDWVCSPCSTPFRDRISAAPPHYSPEHILSAICRDVYLENSGEVLPKFCLGTG